MMYCSTYLNGNVIFGIEIDGTYIHIPYELLFRSKQLQMQMGDLNYSLTNLKTKSVLQ
jgi:hypothetical protein